MSFTQTINNYFLPEISTHDDLIEKMALQIQTYVNTLLGSAWALHNQGNSTLIKNIHFVNPQFMAETIAPQLPCLFVYREESERTKFTCTKDLITSKVNVVFLSNMFRTVDLDKRYGVLDAIPKAVESMLRRHMTIDGYDLEAYLDCETIRMEKYVIGEFKQRYVDMPGFYQVAMTLYVEELVEEAIELTGCEDLDTINYNIDIGETETEALYPNIIVGKIDYDT